MSRLCRYRTQKPPGIQGCIIFYKSPSRRVLPLSSFHEPWDAFARICSQLHKTNRARVTCGSIRNARRLLPRSYRHSTASSASSCAGPSVSSRSHHSNDKTINLNGRLIQCGTSTLRGNRDESGIYCKHGWRAFRVRRNGTVIAFAVSVNHGETLRGL